MRTKKVNLYWCDFCNKAGLQARAMRKHELHCTLNPNRKCRVCDLREDHGALLSDLVAMLPDATAYNAGWEEHLHRELDDAMKAVMPAFRAAANNCPACMMAALRLRKIPVPMVEDFDFKKEMQSIFDDIRESRHEGYY